MKAMNKKVRVIAVSGVLAVMAVSYAGWTALSNRDADTLILYGNVDIREVELGFRVSGRLLEMDFDEGDAVTAGQRLAVIDPEPYREALAVAEARVQQAQADLDKLNRGSRPQEVQQARARVREAEAPFANAKRDFDRQQELHETGASSRKTLDAARAHQDETAARLVAARAALALAEEGFRREDIAAAGAALAAAIAQRDQTKTQLADTALLAPSDGTVLARVREPGTMLMRGAPVYTLSLDKPVYVRAYVGEPDLGKLAPGTTVSVTTDSSEKRYRGQIGFISPRAEFTPKSVETTDLRTDLVYRLRIVVAESDAGLRQGMPVTVHLPRATKAD